MACDRSCLSQLLYLVIIQSLPPDSVWERKGFFEISHQEMRWFFELVTEAWLWINGPTNAAVWERIGSCAHWNMSQVVQSVLLIVSFNCLNHQRFYLPEPGAKGSLQAFMCSHWNAPQLTVYTEAHFRSRPCSSERMWMERIKSVYSCLFMGVHLKPGAEVRGMCPRSKRSQRCTTGRPKFTFAIFAFSLCASILTTPPISKAKRVTETKYLSARQEWQNRHRASISAVWLHRSGSHSQDGWRLVLYYMNQRWKI